MTVFHARYVLVGWRDMQELDTMMLPTTDRALGWVYSVGILT